MSFREMLVVGAVLAVLVIVMTLVLPPRSDKTLAPKNFDRWVPMEAGQTPAITFR